MKKLFTLFIAGLLAITSLNAQDKSTTGFMQITTIESVVNGGLGRSRMIITEEDGTQKEKDLNNLFSVAGINFKNIKENEASLVGTLKSYTDKGWKLLSATPLTLSPNEGGNGIFMTRYLLTK
jgi:hypothetical protein